MYVNLQTVLLSVLIGTSVVSCKIERTLTEKERAKKEVSFDPAKAVNDIWESKVIPYLTKKAVSMASVRDLENSDLTAAGEQFGHRDKNGNSPWTFVVELEGQIVAANTESRAATIDVDYDGDGRADAQVQIGPAIRGTALRDSLDFISFNDFTNQIEYAQFGKAFNKRVKASILNDIDNKSLLGATVKLIGCYQHKNAAKLPLITPATFHLVPAT